MIADSLCRESARLIGGGCAVAAAQWIDRLGIRRYRRNYRVIRCERAWIGPDTSSRERADAHFPALRRETALAQQLRAASLEQS
jgi:hypothetical protein